MTKFIERKKSRKICRPLTVSILKMVLTPFQNYPQESNLTRVHLWNMYSFPVTEKEQSLIPTICMNLGLRIALLGDGASYDDSKMVINQETYVSQDVEIASSKLFRHIRRIMYQSI